MAKYLLIESRDPFDSADVPAYYALAADLARAGNQVTVFLVQNGVLPARTSSRSGELQGLASAGVEVFADDFSLRERGIATDRMARGVKAAPLDVVVDLLADGCKAMWH